MKEFDKKEGLIIFQNVSKFYEISDSSGGLGRIFGDTKSEKFLALSNISFRINRGEMVGIIGQNGAGKSTLLKIIAGTITPTRGQMKIKGRVSAILELGTGFNPLRTGRDNVYMSGLCLGMTRKEIDENFHKIVEFSEIGNWIEKPLRTYSTGMQMRLAFAIATVIESDILIIDEAISVGDAKFQKKCFTRFEELRARGVTILFVTHWAQLTELICDRTIYLKQGEIVGDGLPKPIVARYMEDIRGPAENAQSLTEDAESQERRYGNGGVEIQSIQLLNSQHQPAKIFQAGEKFEVVVKYEIKTDEPILGLNIGVNFTTKEGVRLFATSPSTTKQIIEPAPKGTKGTIRVRGEMNLGLGEYFLTSGAYSPHSDTHYDRRVDAKHFTVTGDYSLSQSLVDLKADYVIEIDNPVASVNA